MNIGFSSIHLIKQPNVCLSARIRICLSPYIELPGLEPMISSMPVRYCTGTLLALVANPLEDITVIEKGFYGIGDTILYTHPFRVVPIDQHLLQDQGEVVPWPGFEREMEPLSDHQETL